MRHRHCLHEASNLKKTLNVCIAVFFFFFVNLITAPSGWYFIVRSVRKIKKNEIYILFILESGVVPFRCVILVSLKHRPNHVCEFGISCCPLWWSYKHLRPVGTTTRRSNYTRFRVNHSAPRTATLFPPFILLKDYTTGKNVAIVFFTCPAC